MYDFAMVVEFAEPSEIAASPKEKSFQGGVVSLVVGRNRKATLLQVRLISWRG